jgi:hypothetical protein
MGLVVTVINRRLSRYTVLKLSYKHKRGNKVVNVAGITNFFNPMCWGIPRGPRYSKSWSCGGVCDW